MSVVVWSSLPEGGAPRQHRNTSTARPPPAHTWMAGRHNHVGVLAGVPAGLCQQQRTVVVHVLAEVLALIPHGSARDRRHPTHHHARGLSAAVRVHHRQVLRGTAPRGRTAAAAAAAATRLGNGALRRISSLLMTERSKRCRREFMPLLLLLLLLVVVVAAPQQPERRALPR